jgi:D-tyrosyl-tRNA(Tyr) deacylase
MKAVIQRVEDACITVDGSVKGSIKEGLLVYIGIAQEDSETDAKWLAEKTAYIRIFDDSEGKMNLSLKDIAVNNPCAGVLAVSQFTLLGDARKGRRPSWNGAAPPEEAKKLYEYFMEKIREHGLLCESGEFQAHMRVSYINVGPVTILLDSKDTSQRQKAS